MTWQRIDENTYIDDTLVTCAEYQLFLDEMREQGKYYQPDHWASYQFPEGRAREPILGMRHSDALEFCAWLTKQEAGEEAFRLSTSVETMAYPLIHPGILWPLGYWVMGADEQSRFAWIGPVPDNPRRIDLARALNHDLAVISTFDHDIVDYARYRIGNFFNGAPEFEGDFKIVRDRGLTYDFDRARDCNLRDRDLGLLTHNLINIIVKNTAQMTERPSARVTKRIKTHISEQMTGRDLDHALYINEVETLYVYAEIFHPPRAHCWTLSRF